MMKPLSQNKITTFAGLITTLTGIVMGLIPQHVWSTCTEAISQTGSPVFVGSLVALGIVLTTVGPSIFKQNGFQK